jgi:hypothetical protein
LGHTRLRRTCRPHTRFHRPSDLTGAPPGRRCLATQPSLPGPPARAASRHRRLRPVLHPAFSPAPPVLLHPGVPDVSSSAPAPTRPSLSSSALVSLTCPPPPRPGRPLRLVGISVRPSVDPWLLPCMCPSSAPLLQGSSRVFATLRTRPTAALTGPRHRLAPAYCSRRCPPGRQGLKIAIIDCILKFGWFVLYSVI